MFRFLVSFLAVLSVVLATGVAEAKDKGNNKRKGPDKVKVDKGQGPKAVPPGQVKRYTRGAKLPNDLDFDYIDDLDDWKLKPLPPGRRYIKIDNEIVSIADDTKTVIDAVGIVGDLMK